MASPPMQISPSWKSSSRLMQRRSVVVPEPLGPITTSASPRFTSVEIDFSTWWSPYHFDTPRISISLAGIVHAPFEIAADAGEGEADDEVDERHGAEDLEGREGALDDLLADVGDVREPDDRDQRRALHDHDAGVDERRPCHAHGLREHDIAEDPGGREAHRARRFPLALGNRENSGAEYFGHEGAEVDADHHDAARARLHSHVRIRQRVVHREKQHQERHAAYDVEID